MLHDKEFDIRTALAHTSIHFPLCILFRAMRLAGAYPKDEFKCHIYALCISVN